MLSERSCFNLVLWRSSSFDFIDKLKIEDQKEFFPLRHFTLRTCEFKLNKWLILTFTRKSYRWHYWRKETYNMKAQSRLKFIKWFTKLANMNFNIFLFGGKLNIKAIGRHFNDIKSILTFDSNWSPKKIMKLLVS